MRKLYRSKTDRRIAGVCGGIAEYLGVDSTIVRLLMAAFILAGGSGLFAYVIAALIIPDSPNEY